MASWFSEDFALGAPLRDPVGALGTAWEFSDPGHTSQYTKLVYARDPSGDVHATYGVDGSPCFYTSDLYPGRTYWAMFVLSGTPASRLLSPASEAGGFTIDAYMKVVGTATESAQIEVYSSPSTWDYDFRVKPEYFGGNFRFYVEWMQPNGSNFGVQTSGFYYVIGAGHLWREDGLYHHIRAEVKAGTITTWVTGTFVSEGNYSGGLLAVASDGHIKLYIDEVLVHTESNIPLVYNFDGQDANESSPGSWETSARLVESNVNRLSLVEIDIVSGSVYWDSVSVGPLAIASWVDIANFHDTVLSYGQFKNGVARVLVDLWTSNGTSVSARLYNVTDSVSAGQSIEVSSTTPVETEFVVALSMGVKVYRLQVLCGEQEVDYFCVGQLLKTAGA